MSNLIKKMEKEETVLLRIPYELEEEFITFLEVGLASVTAYPDELTQNEQRLVQILEDLLRGRVKFEREEDGDKEG